MLSEKGRGTTPHISRITIAKKSTALVFPINKKCKKTFLTIAYSFYFSLYLKYLNYEYKTSYKIFLCSTLLGSELERNYIYSKAKLWKKATSVYFIYFHTSLHKYPTFKPV